MQRKDLKQLEKFIKDQNIAILTNKYETFTGIYIGYDKQGFAHIGDNVIKIQDIFDLGIYRPKKIYKYITLYYLEDPTKTLFYYKTDMPYIEIDDIVLVDRQGREVEAIVCNIELFFEDDVPYPISKTKDIIEVLYTYDDYKDEMPHKDHEHFINNLPLKLDDIMPYSLLTMEMTSIIKYDTIRAFLMKKISNDETYFEIICEVENQHMYYKGNINPIAIYKVIPWLDDYLLNKQVGEGFQIIYSHDETIIFVRNHLAQGMLNNLIDTSDIIIENSWKQWLLDLALKTPYEKVSKPFRTVKAIKGERIYDYITKHIQNNRLPYDFSLEDFQPLKDENEIIVDGMSDYYFTRTRDIEIILILKELTLMFDDNNISSYCVSLIDAYYKKYPERKILSTLKYYLYWIEQNTETIYSNYIFYFAESLILWGQQIETVKLGIAILCEINLNGHQDVVDELLNLALCEEFTFYVNRSISDLKNVNKIRFELIKKLHGYGKLTVLNSLKASNKEIRKWLLMEGTQNDLDYCLTAHKVAKLLNLPKFIHTFNFNELEFEGLYNIIYGLIKDCQDTLDYDKSVQEDIFQTILDNYPKLQNNLKYLHLLCLIKYYLENVKISKNLIKQITNILENDNTKKVLIENTLKGNLEFVCKIVDNTNLDIAKLVLQEYQKLDNLVIPSVIEFLFRHDETLDDTLSFLSQHKNYLADLGKPTNIYLLRLPNLLSIILLNLHDHPLKGLEFILDGLHYKYFEQRRLALENIAYWLKGKKAISYLPTKLYKALLDLKKVEVVDINQKLLNEMLDTKVNLKNYQQTLPCSHVPSENINLFTSNVENLFNKKIIDNAPFYYDENLFYNCIKNYNNYIAYVKTSDGGRAYKVVIQVDKDDNIISMTCDCPYNNNCKHEYATIRYLRDHF